jgi:hypothetical protein
MELHSKGHFLTILANNRLDQKRLISTNTLAYYRTEFIGVVKGVIAQNPVDC